MNPNSQHAVTTGNPFLADNLSAQCKLIKTDPTRAARLVREAENASYAPEENPFRAANLTARVVMMKSDPARAARLQREADNTRSSHPNSPNNR